MDFQNTFTSEGGKRVYEKIADECYKNKNTFVPNSQYSSAFNEGKRYVILFIDGELSKDPYKERQTEARS